MNPQADQPTNGREPNRNPDERSQPFGVRVTDSSPLEGGRFCKTASMSGSNTIDSDGFNGAVPDRNFLPLQVANKIVSGKLRRELAFLQT